MDKQRIEQRLQDLNELKECYYDHGKDTSKLVAEIQLLKTQLVAIPEME